MAPEGFEAYIEGVTLAPNPPKRGGVQWKPILTGAISAFWTGVRILGVAGLPDDFQTVLRVIDMIPAWFDLLGVASLTAFCIFSWQAWGERIKAAGRKSLERARERLKKEAPATKSDISAFHGWRRSGKTRPLWVSVTLQTSLITLLVVALTPWVGFVLMYVFWFSLSGLFWIVEGGEFAEALSRARQAIGGG